MSHYAQVINGIVQQVIVAEQDFIDRIKDDNSEWIQTSYNTRGNLHYGQDGLPDGGTPLRGNYAGRGFIYDKDTDLFLCPRPFPSWTIDVNTATWQPPVAYPADGKEYTWDETTQSWALVITISNVDVISTTIGS